MQIAIIVSGIIAAIFFILSGVSFLSDWGNFKFLALGFLGTAIVTFILIIIRNLKEEWTIGGYKPKE